MTKNRNTLIGVPFTAMRSDGKGFNFDEMNFEGVKDGTDVFDGDVVKFWTGVGWGTQLYHDEDGWWNQVDDDFETTFPNGLPEGTAFFYQSREKDAGAPNVTVTFPGQVPTAPTKNYTAPKNRNTLIANPYPASYVFDEDVIFTGVKDGTDVFDGDVVKFWTGVGWGTQLYHDEDGWWNQVDDDFETTFPNGIPAGTAFFYQSREKDAGASNVTITFKNPIK